MLRKPEPIPVKSSIELDIASEISIVPIEALRFFRLYAIKTGSARSPKRGSKKPKAKVIPER